MFFHDGFGLSALCFVCFDGNSSGIFVVWD